jgi:hypothetical protein
VTRLILQLIQRHQRAALGWSLSPYAYFTHYMAPHRWLPLSVPANVRFLSGLPRQTKQD